MGMTSEEIIKIFGEPYYKSPTSGVEKHIDNFLYMINPINVKAKNNDKVISGFTVSFVDNKVEVWDISTTSMAKKSDNAKADKPAETQPVADGKSLERADKLIVDKKYSEAIGIYEIFAEKGDAYAQYMIGGMFFKGLGVAQDYKVASQWFMKALKNGSPGGAYGLGLMYQEGWGFAKDYKIAASYYSLAVTRIDSSTHLMMSNIPNVDVEIISDGRQIGKINKLHKVEYEAVLNAQHNLAELYFKGLGVEKNYDLALKWVRISAENGLPQSQYSLGRMYYEGKGVQQDYQEASTWVEKAANSGLPEGEYVLGCLYYEGKGKERNVEKALEWFKRSANKNFIPSFNYVAFILAEKGDNLDEARKFAEKAVQANPGVGENVDTLGWVLYKQDNYAEAVKQLEKAVNLLPDDAEVRSHLAETYLKLGDKYKSKEQWTKALDLKPDNKLKKEIQAKMESLDKKSSDIRPTPRDGK